MSSALSIVLIIYLAVGTSHIERHLTADKCEKRLHSLVAAYTKTHVVKASGCFPDSVIQRAAVKK